MHGALSQGLRNRRLMALRAGQVQILVATDVAARGIDVPTITHVINFGLPMKAEDYTHRIGRTGRAGRDGLAVTFAEMRDRRKIFDIEAYTRQPFKAETVPGMEPQQRAPQGVVVVVILAVAVAASAITAHATANSALVAVPRAAVSAVAALVATVATARLLPVTVSVATVLPAAPTVARHVAPSSPTAAVTSPDRPVRAPLQRARCSLPVVTCLAARPSPNSNGVDLASAGCASAFAQSPTTALLCKAVVVSGMNRLRCVPSGLAASRR